MIEPLGWTCVYNQVLCGFLMLLAFHFLLRFLETGRRRDELLQWAAFLIGFGALELNVVYPALDATVPATLSPPVLQQLLRRELGFHGVLISDDLEMRALRDENRQLKEELGRKYEFDSIIGRSGPMQEIFATIERVAPTRATVLLAPPLVRAFGALSALPLVTVKETNLELTHCDQPAGKPSPITLSNDYCTSMAGVPRMPMFGFTSMNGPDEASVGSVAVGTDWPRFTRQRSFRHAALSAS